MTLTKNESSSDPAAAILSKEIIAEIFEATVPYDDDEQEKAARRLVQELTDEEQETAACTSYAYWVALNFHDDKPSEEVRMRMAMREARRHLVAEYDCDFENTLIRLRDCCQFRKDNNVEMLRTLYPINCHGMIKEEPPEEEKMKAQLREYIEEEMEKQMFVVRGCDRESRAVVIKMGRTSPETNNEAYITAQLYLAERGMATTEFLSRGKEEKIIAVMDFENYSSSNSPPLLCLKEMVGMLQAYYPDRLKTGIITEPAFWIRAMYNLVYPLMSETTRDKVQMAYGEKKFNTINALIAPKQAMPFMMPDGELKSPIDMHVFLQQVPFYCTYDSPLVVQNPE